MSRCWLRGDGDGVSLSLERERASRRRRRMVVGRHRRASSHHHGGWRKIGSMGVLHAAARQLVSRTEISCSAERKFQLGNLSNLNLNLNLNGALSPYAATCWYMYVDFVLFSSWNLKTSFSYLNGFKFILVFEWVQIQIRETQDF